LDAKANVQGAATPWQLFAVATFVRPLPHPFPLDPRRLCGHCHYSFGERPRNHCGKLPAFVFAFTLEECTLHAYGRSRQAIRSAQL